MKIIKILMVLGNTGRGGSQSYAMNILRNIHRDRYHIDFVVYKNPEEGYGSEMEHLGCKIFIVPQFKGYNYFNCKKAWEQLLSNEQYDVIHGHASNAAFIYLKIAKKKGCKTILHSHSAGFRGNKLEQFIKRRFSSEGKKYADYRFSCSEKASEKLFGQNYKTFSNYYLLPNAINVEKYKFNSNTRNYIREKIGVVDNSVFICGHVGSFSMPKNHKLLFEIFKKIKSRKPNSKLLLCGEGPLEKEILALINNNNLKEDVVMTGNIPNVFDYMMAMDVLIFPSLFEGLPVTVVEAQAAGLPVVMSDVITPEVKLTDIVKTCSLDDSVEKWVNCVLTFDKFDKIERESYNRIIQTSRFNMVESIKDLEEIYEKIVND